MGVLVCPVCFIKCVSFQVLRGVGMEATAMMVTPAVMTLTPAMVTTPLLVTIRLLVAIPTLALGVSSLSPIPKQGDQY